MNNIHIFQHGHGSWRCDGLGRSGDGGDDGSGHAQQSFPSRPVELIVNFGPGGGADRMGRTVGRLLESNLGVSVPVFERGRLGRQRRLTKVKNSKADGYTIGTITGILDLQLGLRDRAAEGRGLHLRRRRSTGAVDVLRPL